MKIVLTQKEIDRADNTSGRPITIISRPQHDGRYLVAAVDVNTEEGLMGEYADAKNMVSQAVRSVNRWLDKLAMGGETASKSRDRDNRKSDDRYKKGF